MKLLLFPFFTLRCAQRTFSPPFFTFYFCPINLPHISHLLFLLDEPVDVGVECVRRSLQLLHVDLPLLQHRRQLPLVLAQTLDVLVTVVRLLEYIHGTWGSKFCKAFTCLWPVLLYVYFLGYSYILSLFIYFIIIYIIIFPLFFKQLNFSKPFFVEWNIS